MVDMLEFVALVRTREKEKAEQNKVKKIERPRKPFKLCKRLWNEPLEGKDLSMYDYWNYEFYETV